MLTSLLTFAAALLGWSGLLWFGIKPDLLRLSIPFLLALHLVPPLLPSLTVWWHKRRAQRQAEEAQRQQETQAQQAREAEQASALLAHQQELEQRRFGCDCRFIAVTGLIEHEKTAAPELDDVLWTTLTPEQARQDGPTPDPLDALHAPLVEAFQALSTQCAASQNFPIYLIPPADVAGDALLQLVREAAGPGHRSIAWLPGGSNSSERLIGLFEHQPDLPACLVLALDSPHARRINADEEDEEWEPSSQAAAGQAVVLMLLTHPQLGAMLEQVEMLAQAPDADPYTPYWERAELNPQQRRLVTIPLEQRMELADMPVLARLHRAAQASSTEGRQSTLSLTKALLPSLEQALINGGELVPAFEPAGPVPEASTTSPAQAPACRWLVHDAGLPPDSGTRLGALGQALHAFELDLCPIAEASNIVRQYGDTGTARPLLMSALSVIHASQTQGAALCCEFGSEQSTALYLAQPLTS
jgi:hypothetical protein